MKAIMTNKIHSFEYECLNDEHGLYLCEQAYERMGLIGRYYVSSGLIKTWIRF